MKLTENPILVTGGIRCGTTFLGRILSAERHVGRIMEPFNLNYGIEGIDHWFPYIRSGSENEPAYTKMVYDLMQGTAVYKRTQLRNTKGNPVKTIAKLFFRSWPGYLYSQVKWNPAIRRILIKDPIACMACEWLHQKFNMDVVIIVKNPTAFVASMKRLNWKFSLAHLATHQPELYREMLLPFFEGYDLSRLTNIEEAALCWNMFYGVLGTFLSRNDKMHYVTLEDIAQNPERMVSELGEKLRLRLGRRTFTRLALMTAAHNSADPSAGEVHKLHRDSKTSVTRWKALLSSEEIDTVRRITQPVAAQFYNESVWDS